MRKNVTRFMSMVGALAFAGVCSTAAMAQDNTFIQGERSVTVESENVIAKDADLEKTVKTKDTRDAGWYPKLHIGGSAQLGYNKNVDGVTDGLNFTFGVNINGAIDGVFDFGDNGVLEWQNKLDVEEQMSKTPTIDDFFKSKDKLDFQTMLLYRIPGAEWVGPFARFQLTTSIFPGYYISDKEQTVRFWKEKTTGDDRGKDEFLMTSAELNKAGKAGFLSDSADQKRVEVDGVYKGTAIPAQKSVKLASAGIPLTLKESLGVFLDPYQSVPVNVSFKVGFAGQELYTDGKSFTSFDKDDSDGYYDVRLLGDGWTTSLGIEGTAEFKGVLVECFNWSLFGRIYYPFEGDFDKDLYDGADRIHAEIAAKINVKIASWASFDYSLEIKRDPFVTLDWQITNNLLFTVGFDVF